MKYPKAVTAVRGIQKAFKMEDESSFKVLLPHQKSKSTIRKDAKVLQYLKHECQQNGTGAQTLQQVFLGLLRVHNHRLIDLADALEMEDNNGEL